MSEFEQVKTIAGSGRTDKDTMQIKIICILGMVAGVIIAILGFYSEYHVDLSRYDDVRAVRFGADFYTEIHSATATAANNINAQTQQMAANFYDLSSIVRLIPISIGAVMFFHFLLQFTKIGRQQNCSYKTWQL